MPVQSIVSQNMTLKRLFQDCYRVPECQRHSGWSDHRPSWTAADVEARQSFLVKIACSVWDVPAFAEAKPA